MFTKVLVANRGEIAIRIFRTLREMGIASVAVYSEADRESPFVAYADEAYLIGPGPAAESYLKGDTIVDVAVRSGAEAVHPGFGFLAENSDFARACAAAGLTFIGPPPDAMDAMASKTSARQVMAAAGVPIVPGVTDPVETLEDAERIAAEVGLSDRDQGGGGRRRQGHQGRARARASWRRATSRPGARARRTSPTTRSTSSGTWTTRATSRCRCWPISTAR